MDLEKLATALFVTLDASSGESEGDRAKELHRIKGHIPEESALYAVRDLDQMKNGMVIALSPQATH